MKREGADKPESETDGLTEEVGRGRVQLCRDVIPELLAWLLIHWERKVSQIPAVPAGATADQRHYVSGIRTSTQRQLDVIQELIQCLPDTFGRRDWQQACMQAGLLIRATTDQGVPLHKIGAALMPEGGWTDGPRPSTGGGNLPVNSGEASQPEQ